MRRFVAIGLGLGFLGCATPEEDVEVQELAVDEAGDDCPDPSASVTVCGGNLMCVCAGPPPQVTGPHPPTFVCPGGCFPAVATDGEVCTWAEATGQALDPPACGNRSNKLMDECMSGGTTGSTGIPVGGCCTYTRTRRCGPYTYRDLLGVQFSALGIPWD